MVAVPLQVTTDCDGIIAGAFSSGCAVRPSGVSDSFPLIPSLFAHARPQLETYADRLREMKRRPDAAAPTVVGDIQALSHRLTPLIEELFGTPGGANVLLGNVLERYVRREREGRGGEGRGAGKKKEKRGG